MRNQSRSMLAVVGLAVAACSPDPVPTGPRDPAAVAPSFDVGAAAITTVVVRPSDMNGACQTLAAPFACSSAYPTGWLFYNDENDAGDPSLGTFVYGPGTPVLGSGSVQISVSGEHRRNLATYQFAGVALTDITILRFRTYNPSAGNGGSATRSAYLQFNVDFDGSDTWQRRLVYLPSQNGSVLQNTWQEWDALNGGAALWGYSGGTWPVTGGTGTKTWTQIKSDYPDIRIRVTDAQLSLRVGEPYADGYTENIDSFTFGTAGGTTIFDFEPQLGPCSVSTAGTTITLLSDCTTSHTLFIPAGWTLDGNGFTITAVDPAGGHFLGAVVKNAGTSANVTDLTVTASALANVCDGAGPPDTRLRGILFEGAAGSITNSIVTNVNQGPSGCQEGNAIEVRNAPFDDTGTDLVVTIDGNTVNGYIKNGITANGSVAATITNNTVTGSGPVGVPLAAQNGIQIGFGATAVVRGNTISGNNYTPASYVACGILFYQAAGVKASANTQSGNERDNCNYGKGGGIYNPNP
ncbi:MAG TPA: right-handed parallel beta-helix repeat-containing protein [Gemmatimonadales bacterium]